MKNCKNEISSSVLIVGWPGQDSYYMCRHLLNKSQTVDLLSKDLFIRSSGEQIRIINHREFLNKYFSTRYRQIYFLQAFHCSSLNRLDLSYSSSLYVNTLLVADFLDFILAKPQFTPDDIIYTSSRLALTDSKLQSNTFTKFPVNTYEITPYTSSKIATHLILKSFAMQTSIKVTVFYLFNHESPIRSPKFYIPKFYRHLSNKSKVETNQYPIFPINPIQLVDIGHSAQFTYCMLKFLDSSSRNIFESCQLGTGTLVKLESILEGILGSFDDGESFLRSELFDYKLAPLTNHPMADNSYLLRHTNHQPTLYGQDLGKELGMEMKYFLQLSENYSYPKSSDPLSLY